MQIVINVADDGLITLEADGQDPQQFESSEELLEALEPMLPAGEPSDPAEEMDEGDPQMLWDQEAKRRGPMA